MNNYEFVKFAANRFGIDETLAESIVDMFAQSLQELISSGQSVPTAMKLVNLKSVPLFPKRLNQHISIALAKAENLILLALKLMIDWREEWFKMKIEERLLLCLQ